MKKTAPLLIVLFGAVLNGCGDLPALPTSQSHDGAASSDVGGDAPAWDGSVDSPAMDVSSVDAPGVDVPLVDASGNSRLDSGRIDASAIDAPYVLVCPSGFADCNGDDSDGCETALDTPDHCGGCKTVCGAVANASATCVNHACVAKCSPSYADCDGAYANGCEVAINTPSHCGSCTNACGGVANGSAACVNGKCAVKCNAPYQDCDGKYENGCEIPVGQANGCDRNGLAAFSGDTPPCGTPYCGSSSASGSAVNFGSWYCSFCDHCHAFGNGGSYCLYNPGNGRFSGERCSNCCAANDTQSCPKQ